MERNEEKLLSQKTGMEAVGLKDVQPGLPQLCRRAGAEGVVLLKNNGVLPLTKEKTVAVFGRAQVDYFCVGYGSGGDVNPPYRISLLEGLRQEEGVSVNETLASVYEQWCAQQPGEEYAWGKWPRYLPEMPVDEELIAKARSAGETALVVIGRAAGEDRENLLEPGSYELTQQERELLSAVTEAFEDTIVVVDTGNVMDLSWMAEYRVSAVVLAWQGGMESGRALADVLSGRVTPSGRLTDSIAWKYQDYPSAAHFGGTAYNNYAEDLFVGYRYFETFAPEKVQFPFGFGLSYTAFDTAVQEVCVCGGEVQAKVTVTNTGDRFSGAQVVQLYVSAPQGKLGKAARSLIAFGKTQELKPGESQQLTLTAPVGLMASYDDSGVTGHAYCYVLEAGEYVFYAGADVRSASRCGSWTAETLVIETLSQAAAPEGENGFERLCAAEKDGAVVPVRQPVPVSQTDRKTLILNALPEAIARTGDRGWMLADVKAGRVSLEDFIAQLSDEDLNALSLGEGGMDSPQGPKGNAGVFAGHTDSLKARGVPVVVTTDGPSGIRLACYASLYPCGTALASTWNLPLMEALGTLIGKEMCMKGTHVLLGPGMNIHRDPLCGRNFEYYSEDPLITGKMGAAMVRGIQSQGRSACPKHFACNNQETLRTTNDSRVSERALREIYLKGFEICVKEAGPFNLMTSYNKVNGVWAHYHYDLVTRILRGEWGYQGNVMTDWWMRDCADPDFENVTNNAYRVRAQVDVLMPGGRSWDSKEADDTLLTSFREGGITLGELQRAAANVLRCAMRFLPEA
ncbi:MAG: glycoside hydrolase family 3 protein [Clostridia bacterium]|nr:glycoside hydrolase family 3 protein [Clostridia bacterium]